MRRCHWLKGAAPELPRGWVPLRPYISQQPWTLRTVDSGQPPALGSFFSRFSTSRSFSRRPLAGSEDS